MANPSFEILDCVSGRIGFDTGYYRILVDSSTIKYLAFHAPDPWLPDVSGERLAFSMVPAGDWNIGKLVQNPGGQQFRLASTDIAELKGIEKTWHQSFVDWMDLSEPISSIMEGDLQCMAHLSCATYEGHLGYDKVVVDHDWFPMDVYGPEQETRIYALIDGHNVAPKFIAHVTENKKRVIGYMVQKISGRAATADDLPACQAILRRLHALGIAHGALTSMSFLVADNGVYLHGFGASYQTGDPTVFAKELDTLSTVLEAGWKPPMEMSQELAAQIEAIHQRDDGIHPALFDQAMKEGRVTITAEQHREMLLELRTHQGLWKPTL